MGAYLDAVHQAQGQRRVAGDDLHALPHLLENRDNVLRLGDIVDTSSGAVDHVVEQFFFPLCPQAQGDEGEAALGGLVGAVQAPLFAGRSSVGE